MRADESATHGAAAAARWLVLVVVLAWTSVISADDGLPEAGSDELAELDLEALMDIEVTLVAGDEQSLRETPAAVFVITAEDLRRGGFNTIPDALRIVPGLNVAQVHSTAWAVSARGFNQRFASKMLVLIDGRAIYTDLFAGTIWLLHDLPIEEVERIEVIRGPGATVWGANAVNGVINIVTLSAETTSGGLARVTTGNLERAGGYVRYGGKLGDELHFRIYSSGFDREGFDFADGNSAHGDSQSLRVGGRIDGTLSEHTRVSFHAGYHTTRFGEHIAEFSLTPPYSRFERQRNDTDGNYFLARFERLDENGKPRWSIQAFADRDRLDANGFRSRLGTYDAEARYFHRAIENHEIVVGVGYRRRYDVNEWEAGSRVMRSPQDRDTDKYNAFVQDTIRVSDDFSLMLGTKVERNEYTGWEVQPSARATWRIDETRTMWAAVSRAVRTPSRGEHDLIALLGVSPPPPVALPIRLLGDPDNDSEELIAYEAGLRVRPHDTVSLDFSLFYNDYDDLLTVSRTGALPTDIYYDNATEGEIFGTELAASWQARENWRLHFGYAFAHADLRGGDETDEEEVPEHTVILRSHLDLTENFELNASGFYVDHLPNQRIGSYFRFDLGATWRVSEDISLSLWGHNLTENHHAEQLDTFYNTRTADVPRSFLARLQVRF